MGDSDRYPLAASLSGLSCISGFSARNRDEPYSTVRGDAQIVKLNSAVQSVGKRQA
jgi:hypothetical protein